MEVDEYGVSSPDVEMENATISPFTTSSSNAWGHSKPTSPWHQCRSYSRPFFVIYSPPTIPSQELRPDDGIQLLSDALQDFLDLEEQSSIAGITAPDIETAACTLRSLLQNLYTGKSIQRFPLGRDCHDVIIHVLEDTTLCLKQPSFNITLCVYSLCVW
jgi:hypothetical protein